MSIMHRIIHQIAPDKWGEVMEWEKKFAAVEKPYGGPPTRWYRANIGAETTDTMVGEREFESVADAERIYAKAMADPAWQKLNQDSACVFLTTRHEIWQVLK